MATNGALKISPSKLERAALCPGSARMTKDLPWKDSPAAARGRALHDCMALLFQAGEDAWEQIRKNVPQNPNCKPEDLKQLEAAFAWGKGLLYADDDLRIIIERPLDIDFMGLSGGKPDAIFISPAYKQATVIDWKFGSGSVEDPERNWQMKAYAAGTSNTYGKTKLPKVGEIEIESIDAVIIQPAGFKKDDSVRSHTFSNADLSTHATEIKKIVTAAKAPNAPTIAGPIQCRFCDAKPNCASYAQYAAGIDAKKKAETQAQLATVSTDGTPILVEPEAPISFPVIVVNAETVAQANDYKAQALAVKVDDELSANDAGKLSKNIRALANLIDKNREIVKKPFLSFGRDIDAAAKAAMTPLIEAAAHLDDQVGSFVKAEQAKAAAARAEQERKEAEAIKAREAAEAAERKKAAEAAELQRQADEAEERAKNMKTKAAREKAEKEAADARAAAAKAEQERLAQERKAQEAAQLQTDARSEGAAVAGPAKVAGFRNTVETTFQIPDFSKIPVDLLSVVLMPNTKVIDSMIKTGVLNEAKHSAWLNITRTDTIARSR